MTERIRWFSRTFAFDAPPSAFPAIIERLRGTPARLEDRLQPLSAGVLTTRLDEQWSIQENARHLLDLEPLWAGRLDDFEGEAERLRAADLDNRRTHDAGHNAVAVDTILAAFRHARLAFVARLERYHDPAIVRTALHPRLSQPMRVIDHALFVAEHDDHHLVTITELLRHTSGLTDRLTRSLSDSRGERQSSRRRS